MNAVVKHIVARTYKPWLEKYLAKTRVYRYGNVRLDIPPQVFHPGFFFSTRLLLQYIRTLSLAGKKFLELGAGSGLISVVAAKNNALVTATDINPVAIQYLQHNCEQNKVSPDIIFSDLFQHIPEQQFDIIAINPPYYKREPRSPADHAWCCGEKGEYFAGLFGGLHAFIHDDTAVIMVLCDGCDIPMIETIAATNRFGLQRVQTRRNLLEKNFIYKIEAVK